MLQKPTLHFRLYVFALLFASVCGIGCKSAKKEDPVLQSKKYIKAGDMHFMKREYEKAMGNWEKAISLAPKENAYLYNNMAVTYYTSMKDREEAKKLWEKQISLNPKAYTAYSGIGNYYKDKKQYKKAIEYYKKSISKNPNYFMSLQNMGDAYFEIKEYAEAEKSLKKALKIMKKNFAAYFMLGKVYAAQGRLSEAERVFKKSTRIMPTLYLAHYELGNLYVKKRRISLAIEAYKKTIKLGPEFSAAYNGLAYLYANTGIKLKEGEKLIKKAISLENSYAYIDTLGWIYYKQNKYAEAESKIKEAIKLAEADKDRENEILAEGYYHLGMVLMRLKRKDEASKSLAKAKDFSEDSELSRKIQSALSAAR